MDPRKRQTATATPAEPGGLFDFASGSVTFFASSIGIGELPDRPRGDVTEPLDWPMARRILTKGQMRSNSVVIAGVGSNAGPLPCG
jgi:hypothetical protein